MKKIFILTGEPSGDRLAAKVISKLKTKDPKISYLCLGGEELKSLGINSISDLNQVTYLGFTRVLLNIFKNLMSRMSPSVLWEKYIPGCNPAVPNN